MKLKIVIDMDNAAFEGINGAEVARILRRLAKDVEEVDIENGDHLLLRDFNGNSVGGMVCTDKE